ncbi:prolyl 4-hydroxylase subunit alpha-1-like [Ylistrum balloti]|uniref:prolyl 4-hydroxylase subunit alpha-1-like n=1 Tax=Ylistrum balloti TaxID=509963 RepID=UPI002905956B|nr:prolyl 4-hydroxylase subunit alpha-1-like [Ylistrum balloti]
MVSGTILNIRASPLTSSNIVNIAQALETEKQIAWYEAFQEIADVTERDSILYKTAIAYHLTGLSVKALDILTNLQQTSTRSLETMTKIVRLKAESQEENQQEDKEVGSQNPLDIVYKQLCKTQTSLTRARVFKGDDQEVDGSRTGDSASLKIRTSTTVKLEKRIELLTGLDASVGRDIKTSDKLQVVNYGLGGHYSRHYDDIYCRTETAMHHGNYTRNERIATWIFYLNDVEAGGATVFPLLKIRIVPIKGSAVFWYNLMPSGETDFRSQHAACPVILGTKWITTKWIRELGQELRKPCKTQYSAEHF